VVTAPGTFAPIDRYSVPPRQEVDGMSGGCDHLGAYAVTGDDVNHESLSSLHWCSIRQNHCSDCLIVYNFQI
jgi:hypothetical protein